MYSFPSTPTFLVLMMAAMLPPSNGFTAVPTIQPPHIRSSSSPSSTTSLDASLAMPLPNYPLVPPPPLRQNNHHQKKKKKQEEASNNNKKTSKAHEIVTLEDFKKVVGEETEQLVVVKFYAPWCRACKAMSPSYQQLTRQEENSQIKFVDAPMTAVTSEIHQALGVTTIPFVHIYHPKAGLIDERKIGRKYFSDFKKVLKTLVDGSCDVGSGTEEEEDGAMYAASPYKVQEAVQL